jgi:anti-sigma regulatory factor (Ser/Thr protein kinase)
VLADRLVDTVNSVLAAANTERTHAELCRRMISLECSFAIENDIGVVMSTPAYVTSHLTNAGFGDRLAQLRTRMALEEALVNAMYLGNLELGSELKSLAADELYRVTEVRRRESPYAERRIHVRAAFSSEQAQFTVRDDGKGFDSATLLRARDTSCLDRADGRGVMLMRTFMDEVRYNDVGNEVTMVKNWTTTSASS